MGWIFQDFHLLDNLTAIDNVAMALELSGMPSSEAVLAAQTALTKVLVLATACTSFLTSFRAASNSVWPSLVPSPATAPSFLADEPTGNLDIASGKEVTALFKELCHDEENPISILMVTHDPDLASNADRMLLLNDGRTEASDIRSAWGLDDEDDTAAEAAETESEEGGEEEW